MTGVAIDIELDDTAVRTALTELARRGASLTRPLANIGEHLLNSTRERFTAASTPDGDAWEPLSQATVKRKTHNAGKILFGDGNLFGLLRVQVDGNRLQAGTNLVYAAMQQFGGKKSQFPHLWGDIPARPFLGVSEQDRRDIVEILGTHLTRA